MTPFELGICAEVYSENHEAELYLEWVNAYWQRVDPLKSFHEMIGKEIKPKVMTGEQMLAAVMGLNAQMGGTSEKDPNLLERG